MAEQRVSFTTDAFQFSSARRLRFSDDPSLPTVVPLDKPEDIIWEPSLEVKKMLSSSSGRTELSVKGRGFIFTDKPVFTHGDYRAQVRHVFDQATSILLRYRHAPNLFLGPNFERRTGDRLIQDERVTTNKWRLEVMRQWTERLASTLIGRYGWRSYNEAFAERDTQFWTIGSQLAYELWPKVTGHVTYLFERGLADGAGDLRFSDDVSYRLHHLSAGFDLALAPRWLLTLMYTYQQKQFTSDLVDDTHFGRRDHLHQGLADLGYQASDRVLVSLSVQRTQRQSTNALRDFNDTIVSLGGQYRF